MKSFLMFLLVLSLVPAFGQIPTNGLVAHYPFNGNANDASGNGNNGIVRGAALTSDRFGVPNQAYHFNGTANYIDVPHSPSLEIVSALTITAWVYLDPDVPAISKAIITKGIDDPQTITGDWTLTIHNNDGSAMRNRPHAWLSGGFRYFDGNAVIRPGVWYHVAMTYDGTKITSYVNGWNDGSMTASGPMRVTNSTMRIGVYDPSVSASFFTGTIDDIRVYNRALSPSEIAAVSGLNFGGLRIWIQDAENWGEPGTRARAVLYTSGGTPILAANADTNSSVSFGIVPEDSGYYYRVYVNRTTPWGEEFWGEKRSVSVAANQTTYETFVHNTPYMPMVEVYGDSANVLLPEGGRSVIAPGTRLRVELQLKNPTYPGALDVLAQGRLYLDRDRQAPYDLTLQTDTRNLAVGSNGTAVAYCIAPNAIGAYYLSVAALASSARYPTALTDASGWHDPAFVVATSELPCFSIYTVEPLTGKSGDAITITGCGFDTQADSNIVYFGAVRAYITTASQTSLMVTVPAGAIYAPVTVTARGKTCFSMLPFIPTYDGTSDIHSLSFAPTTSMAPGEHFRWGAIADLDGDGKPDLAGTNNNNSVSVFRNTSTPDTLAPGSFAGQVDFAVGTRPYNLKAVDLDGDGKLDLAAIANSSASVTVLRNTSTPGTLSFQRTDFTTCAVPQGIASADLDGDGRPDLVVSGSQISILRNTSAIQSISFAPQVSLSSSGGFMHVATADIDGDGKADIVAAKRVNPNVDSYMTVFRNTSEIGNIQFSGAWDFQVGRYAEGIAVGDLDGDGKQDVALTTGIASETEPKRISVFRNASTGGSIAFDTRRDLTPIVNSAWKVTIADLNGDGRPDIAVPIDNGESSLVSVFGNASVIGHLQFDSKVDIPTQGLGTYELSIGDLDLDGRPDLAVGSLYNNTSGISLHRNTTGSVTSAVTVSLPTRAGLKGTIAEIPMTVSDVTGKNVLSYQFTVTFNSPHVILNAMDDVVTAGTLSGSPGWTVVPNVTEPNRITVGAFGSSPLAGSGVLVGMKFFVDSNATEGQYSDLHISECIFNAGVPEASTADGRIMISTLVCGDADENGQVQAFDAALTLRDAIGLQPLTAQGRTNADVDMNGQVQAFDAALILRKAVGLPMPPGISTCFLALAKSENGTTIPAMLQPVLVKARRINGRTSAQLQFEGDARESGILALSFDIEMAAAGSDDNTVTTTDLPDGYVSIVNRHDGRHSSIAIIQPQFIDMRDLTIALEVADENALRGLRVTSIRLNATSLPDVELSGGLEHLLPKTVGLVGSYPNPFNPSSTIVYDLPERSLVTLELYDLLGLRVKTLVSEIVEERRHTALWDGTNDAGQAVSTGQYFCRMRTETYVNAIRLILLK